MYSSYMKVSINHRQSDVKKLWAKYDFGQPYTLELTTCDKVTLNDEITVEYMDLTLKASVYRVNITYNGKTKLYTAIAGSKFEALRTAYNDRIFEHASYKHAAKSVCTHIVDKSSTTEKQEALILQWNQSDLDFIRTCALYSTCNLIIDWDTIVFFNKATQLGYKLQHTLLYHATEHTEHMLNQLMQQEGNPAVQAYTYDFTFLENTEIEYKGNTHSNTLPAQIPSQVLEYYNKPVTKFVTLKTKAPVRLGAQLTLDVWGEESKLIACSVIYEYSEQSFAATVICADTVPLDVDLCMHISRPTYLFATVLDTVDEFNRVLVQFLWKNDKYNQAWCSVLNQGSTKANSIFYTPNPGDQVLVNLIANSFVIIGCLYNATNRPDHDPTNLHRLYLRTHAKDKPELEHKLELNSDDNRIDITSCDTFNLTSKGTATQHIKEGDYQLTLDKGTAKTDITEGEYTLQVHKDISVVSKEQNIVFDAKQEYKVSSKASEHHTDKYQLAAKDKITITTPNYTLEADSSKITVTSTNIELKATNIKLHAESKISLTAPNITIAADMDLALGGLNVSVDAKVNAKVKANAEASIQGSGLVQIQGGLVKIN